MRIFHGPVNIVGIGGHLAAYQRKKGHDAQFIVWTANPFMGNHDQVIFKTQPQSRAKSLLIRLGKAFKLMREFDVFHFYFGKSLLPLSLDLPILRLMRKKVIMTYCGSDIRLGAVEKKRNPYWPLVADELAGTLNDSRNDLKKIIKLKWQGIWSHKIIAPRNAYKPVSKFVEKNKIVADIWVHNLSYCAQLKRNDQEVSEVLNVDKKLRIVHVPSSPVIKGTKFFRKAISDLKSEGFDFEYIEVIGKEHDEAMSELRKADIVLDQLLLGGFGSLSVEGMSMGKPVICYLIDSVKKEHYDDCPIMNTNIDNLKENIAHLIKHEKLRKQLGEQGRVFVRRHFDYKSINEAVLKLYA